jgi:desulfoferrodoxin-like iron-binding protein
MTPPERGETTQSDQDHATVAPGSRFRCETCGSEAIVLQPGAAQLTCCGAPLVQTFDGASRS